MQNLTADLVHFENLGRQAHRNGKMNAPALNPEVMVAIDGMPVGGGAAEIMKAYSRGYEAAIEDELRALGF